MTSSWKIGAISGLIAGIVAGVIETFVGIYNLENGLPFYGLHDLSFIPIKEIAMVEISLYIIWCIVLGILFSRVYDLVPGKGILKGLIFGLIYCLIYPIRWVTFNFMYGLPTVAFAWLTGVITIIPLALAFGISHDLLNKKFVVRKEKIVTMKYDVKGGFYPGAIAGAISGATSYLAAWIIINPIIYQRYMTDVGFQLGQFGTLVFFDMIWGIVFGILFVMFYVRVPRSGVLKGVIFAISVFFFTNFQDVIRNLIYYQLFKFDYKILIFNLWGFLAALSVFIPFGIVIGLLYRKPTAAPSEKKEDIQTVRMVKCIHCNASIAKGSEYCNKCGKKQV